MVQMQGTATCFQRAENGESLRPGEERLVCWGGRGEMERQKGLSCRPIV